MAEVVKVEGLRELRIALMQKVPLHMQGPTLQKALAAGARIIVAAAKSLAPERTGVLRRAIYSFRSKDSDPTFEVRNIGVRSGKRYQKSRRDAFYWKFVEFGHRVAKAGGGYLKKLDRPHGKGSNPIGVVPPRPFLRPAFASKSHEALKAITERLKVEIEIAAKKASWRTSASGGAATAGKAIRKLGS